MQKPATKRKAAKAEEAPTPLPSPDEVEVRRMLAADARNEARGVPVSVKVDLEAQKLTIAPPHDDGRGWLIRLKDAVGTNSDEFALGQMNHLASVLRAGAHTSPGTTLNAMLAGVEAVRPENELEGALAVQMAATHEVAMLYLGKVATAPNPKIAESYSTIATKMLRTYTTQLEALSKSRRGGAQKVTVEHVHVHSGGQAIVGHIGAGGRGSDGNDHRPHAPALSYREPALAAAVGDALLCDDAERDGVPVAGGEGKASMPHARRRAG